MSDNKIELFSAFRHVVPSDYEAWFEQMAAEGWHINEIKQWDSVFIKFHRGTPKKLSLCLRSATFTSQGLHPNLRTIRMGASGVHGERSYLADGI